VAGGPARASAYLEDLGGLSKRHTLLLLDQRGTGGSELPADRDSLAFPRLADDLADVRRGLGYERLPVLAHSAGCLVAMIDATRRPDEVERLVLVTPPGRGFGDTADDVARVRASRSGEPWWPEVAEVLESLPFLPEHRRQRVDRALRPLFYARWDDRAQAHADTTDGQMSMRAAAAFVPSDAATIPPPQALAALTAQTLVVVGEIDGATGPQAGHVIAGMLPNARVVSLPGVAHYPWIDDPARFSTVVADFLGGE
jgi:pimeloyl-ACP methyl ester carboxylesterase